MRLLFTRPYPARHFAKENPGFDRRLCISKRVTGHRVNSNAVRRDARTKWIRKAAAGCAAVLLAGGLAGCGGPKIEAVQKTDTAMGTIIRQNLYVREDQGVADGVMDLIEGLEKDLLSWRLPSSQIYRLNEGAGAEGGEAVSEQLWEILQSIWSVSEKSGGALDVTVGDVVRLWDIDSYAAGEKEGGFEAPSEDELRQALKDAGYDKVVFKDGRLYLPEGMNLDLGAVGKGIACGRVQEYLRGREEVTGAVISVGGSVATYGSKPDGSPWKVGILNPDDTGSYLGTLVLDGTWCVSTSGDYERYVEAGGVRYHHILDPSDGWPADSGVRSVTVLTGDGLLSDALSTACFVLGEEKGLKLAEDFGAEALFVGADGRISMTEGMKGVFREN